MMIIPELTVQIVLILKCRKKKILKVVGDFSSNLHVALEELHSFVTQSKNSRVQSILNQAITTIQTEISVFL